VVIGVLSKRVAEAECYNHCERFEEMPGNMPARSPSKILLQKALGTEGNPYNLITEKELHSVKWEKIDMSSFNFFRKRLENVLAEMNGREPPHPRKRLGYLEG
jgi:hypothetical protein